MNKKQKIIIIVTILLFIIYLGSSFLFEKEEKVEVKESITTIVEKEEEPVVELYKVDIKGQVENPGVYEVPEDARVIDVIELAGGLKKDANTDYLNLSKKVEDGSVIWIYTTKEIEKLTEVKTVIEYIEKECNCPDVSNSACVTNSDTTTSNNVTGKININQASLEELITLDGIGESKAKAIIEYRTNTPFESIEDIKNVSGIGDSAYEKIKDYITV